MSGSPSIVNARQFRAVDGAGPGRDCNRGIPNYALACNLQELREPGGGLS
jgi:hypothetical protein